MGGVILGLSIGEIATDFFLFVIIRFIKTKGSGTIIFTFKTSYGYYLNCFFIVGLICISICIYQQDEKNALLVLGLMCNSIGFLLVWELFWEKVKKSPSSFVLRSNTDRQTVYRRESQWSKKATFPNSC